MRLIGLLISATFIAKYTYIYFKLRSAVGPGWMWTFAYVLVSVFIIGGSRVMWLVDLSQYPEFRRMLAYGVYMGTAFFFLLFTVFAVLDLLRFFVWLIDTLFSARFGDFFASAKLRAFIAVGFALFACVYGWFEALNIRPTHITIETEKLPADVDRLRIAHITDVHLGWIVQEERLDMILDVVRAAEPDMLVSTGDLVDDNMEFRDGEIELFRGLDLPLGMYAVTGNHEYYVGVQQSIDFKERAGMRVLRNEAKEAGGVMLVGMDDPTGRRFGEEIPPEYTILSDLPDDRFVLLLKHQPTVEAEAVGLFDLMLAGHTHGGQIWPFYWLTRMVYDYRPGLRALAPAVRGGEAYADAPSRESRVYVSNGSGTWGPPLRFLAPSEVVIVDIVRK